MDYYEEHMKPLVEEDFVLDPPAFQYLNTWTTVVFNIFTARVQMEEMQKQELVSGDMADIQLYIARFQTAIASYDRCFVRTAGRYVMLNAKTLFAKHAHLLPTHERMMQLRHQAVAHTLQSDMVRQTIAVREETDRFVMRQLNTMALPKKDLADYFKAVAVADDYVSRRIMTHIKNLSAKLGKPIVMD